MQIDEIQLLRLLQLADSALPIGSAAHSFGIETLTVDDALTVTQLEQFLRDYLEESGRAECIFCCLAYRLARAFEERAWLQLNAQLSAFKTARESRNASATLGRRFLQLASDLIEAPMLSQALQYAKRNKIDIHYSTAFGLVGYALTIDESATVLAYLQQSVMGLVSACQRLLPLGQNQASRILWRLQSTLIALAQQYIGADLHIDDVVLCTPLVDLGSMRHPTLSTRLFVS